MAQKFFDGLKKKFQALSKQQKYFGLAALVLLVVLLVLIFAGPKPFSVLGFGNQSIKITNAYSERNMTPSPQQETSLPDQTNIIDEEQVLSETMSTEQKPPSENTNSPNTGSTTQLPRIQPTATQRRQQNPTATPGGSNPYPVQPTNTRVAPTSQPTATVVPLPTEPYDGPEAIWLGEWNVKFELDNGTFQTGKISFEIVGGYGEFRATGKIGGQDINVEGRIVFGGLVVFGSWTAPFGSGQLELSSSDGLVFGGNHDTDLAFCGAREGNNLPTECYIPPSQ